MCTINDVELQTAADSFEFRVNNNEKSFYKYGSH